MNAMKQERLIGRNDNGLAGLERVMRVSLCRRHDNALVRELNS